MTNCIGSVISVDCGEFGYYQGRLISLDAKAKDIVLASAFREGIPLGKNVTLNGSQIISLKVLKAAPQVDPQVASTSSSRLEKKDRVQKPKGIQQNGIVMHRTKSTTESMVASVNCEEKSRIPNQMNSWKTRPSAAVQNKSTTFERERKASSLSSASEEAQSTEIDKCSKKSKNHNVRKSGSEYVHNNSTISVSETPRFRRFEPQVPLPREVVIAKVKNRNKAKGPSGNPLLDSKKLPGKVASANNELIKPIDFDLLSTDFDFDANLERFKKEDFDEEYYDKVEKQKMSQNFAHYENIIDDPSRCISWTNMYGSNGVIGRVDTCSKSVTERRSPQVRSISFCPSKYETTYDGFPLPVLDVALKKKYLQECCASIGPDVFHYLVADRFIMWLIDVSGRLSISIDDVVVLAPSSTSVHLIDRILSHLDNRGARTILYGKFPSFDFGLVSAVDKVSALPSAPKVIVVLSEDITTETQKWLRKQTTSHVVSLECCPNVVDYRKVHILMLGVLTSGIYCVPSKSQPQLGKTSFEELCASAEANKFIDSAVCDVGAPFSWIADDGKASLLQAFSTTLMRRLC